MIKKNFKVQQDIIENSKIIIVNRNRLYCLISSSINFLKFLSFYDNSYKIHYLYHFFLLFLKIFHPEDSDIVFIAILKSDLLVALIIPFVL